mmetsp:Transcript_169092/g.543466  ORF Transcript_169092/g.543466 Transcript_169092/m.543466 type:complete len:266 (+) Transcript_169092:2984-3781(+)
MDRSHSVLSQHLEDCSASNLTRPSRQGWPVVLPAMPLWRIPPLRQPSLRPFPKATVGPLVVAWPALSPRLPLQVEAAPLPHRPFSALPPVPLQDETAPARLALSPGLPLRGETAPLPHLHLRGATAPLPHRPFSAWLPFPIQNVIPPGRRALSPRPCVRGVPRQPFSCLSLPPVCALLLWRCEAALPLLPSAFSARPALIPPPESVIPRPSSSARRCLPLAMPSPAPRPPSAPSSATPAAPALAAASPPMPLERGQTPRPSSSPP